MPPSKRYQFHPEAWAELEAADVWYRERNPEASVRFLAAVYDALEDVMRQPQTWPKYLHGTRKILLQRFPYALIYRERVFDVQILALTHTHRRPGYWRKRL
jgi:plasmid stabilization system protein ParE